MEKWTKKSIKFIEGYDLLSLKRNKEFEIKIFDNSTGETLIIDNDFISKKPLKLEDYIPLCEHIKKRLESGITLSGCSLQ